MIIINTKNYKTGNELLKLAKLIESYDTHIVLAVPTPDISMLVNKTILAIYAQHTDLIENDQSTGFVSPKSIKAQGASGVILNHSEHKLSFSLLKKTIAQCKKEKLPVLVCAATLSEARSILALKPEMLAYEDPQLIGTGKSITTYKAQDLTHFITLFNKKGTIPFCGAGISTIKDVQAAYNLGCKGVLIASAIANNPKPDIFLRELAQWKP